MWQEDRGRVQNEEVFQKSVLAGTAVVTKTLNPPSVRAHTLMREYSRLISRKNMPVYVCEDLSSEPVCGMISQCQCCALYGSASVCHNRVPRGHMARLPPGISHEVEYSPLVTINSSVLSYPCLNSWKKLNDVVDNKQYLFMSMYLKMYVF